MEQSLFGGRFQEARQLLESATDPVHAIALSADVACAVYESESSDLGLVRFASGFSPELREVEQEFEELRYAIQGERVRALFDAGRARPGITADEARRILWMYTSREVFRMLVHEGRWTPERYREWLSNTLLEALVDASP